MNQEQIKAVLKRYRDYKRRGLLNPSTEQETLLRRNEMLLVALAKSKEV
jgi:hypothetical protein